MCEWAAAQLVQTVSDSSGPAKYDHKNWLYEKNDPTTETLISPCGRYELHRVRLSIASRRYSLWDKYPTDGPWIATLISCADSPKDALRPINENTTGVD